MPTGAHRIANLVLAAAVGVAVLVVGLPALGLYQVHLVATGSMAPAIPAGSLIVSRPASAAALAVGDVVTYVHDGARVTHRLHEVADDGGQLLLRTKGDANPAPDGWQVTAAPGDDHLLRQRFHLPLLTAFFGDDAPSGRSVAATTVLALLGVAAIARMWLPQLAGRSSEASVT